MAKNQAKKIWKELKKSPALLIGAIAVVGLLLYLAYKSNANNNTGMGFNPDMTSLYGPDHQQAYEINLLTATPPPPPSPIHAPGKKKKDEHHKDHNDKNNPPPKPHPTPKPGQKPPKKPPVIVQGPFPPQPGKHPQPTGPKVTWGGNPPQPHTPMHSSIETGMSGSGSTGHKVLANPPHIVVPPIRPGNQGNLRQPHRGKVISPPVKPISSGAPTPTKLTTQYRIENGKRVVQALVGSTKHVGYVGSLKPGDFFLGPTGVGHIRSGGDLTLSQIASRFGGTWNDIYSIPDNQKMFGKMTAQQAANYKPKAGVNVVVPGGPTAIYNFNRYLG